MSNAIIVAKAKENVQAPVEFTGKIKRAVLLQNEESGETYASFDIEGLPNLTDSKGRKVTIIRNMKQLIKADMSLFITKGDDAMTINQALAYYAKGREATVNISAHEAGAYVPVTEFTKAEQAKGKEIGETFEASSAGFYLEGAVDIDFDRNDVKEALQASRALRASISTDSMLD